jgi:hypothetical protein
MVVLQQEYRNHTLKEGNMESTAIEMTAMENDVHRLAQENADLSLKLKAIQFQLDGFREVINGLPWEDINTGEFSPSPGCGDVADARDAFITFGCCEATLREGTSKAYKVEYKVDLTVTILIESATSEEDAEQQADDVLEGLEVTANHGNLDEWDIDSCGTVADNVIEQ